MWRQRQIASPGGRIYPMSESDTILCGASAVLPCAVCGIRGVQQVSNEGVDAMSQVPTVRWTVTSAASLVVARRVRHGGFVLSPQCFDHQSFGLSPAEVHSMDPQQRLMLEEGYAALHAGGLRRAALMSSSTGVFAAVYASDFAQLLATSPAGWSVFAATGCAHSIASGRISFALGMQGPCLTYDSACSSALVASHGALRAMQRNECAASVVPGANLMLTPARAPILALAGMTSALGRCHTFDHRADGYARAESCCAICLRHSHLPGAGAQDVVDNMLHVRGSAVRQDGKSASLTAPNGRAQHDLLEVALSDAALASDDLATLEAHGTGTALGDPVEVGAFIDAIVSSLAIGSALSLGGAKASVGHAEGAAGFVGLMKMAAMLCSNACAPNAQLRVFNRHVLASQHGQPCAFPTHVTHLRHCGRSMRPSVREHEHARGNAGGVSSLGYSGTIAHSLFVAEAENLAGAQVLASVHPYRRRTFAWHPPTQHPARNARSPEALPGGCPRVLYITNEAALLRRILPSDKVSLQLQILESLALECQIVLRVHHLPEDETYDRHTAALINLDGCTIIFVGVMPTVHVQVDKGFCAALRERAAHVGAQLLNAATPGPEDVATTILQKDWSRLEFPAVVRPNANALHNDALVFVTSQAEFEAWRQRSPAEHHSGLFSVSTWMQHHATHPSGPFRIERWLFLAGDLTVGIRWAPDRFIKQHNSLGHLLRDLRQQPADTPRLLQQQATGWRERSFLTFQYHDEPAFWDVRLKAAMTCADRLGFCFASMDAIEVRPGELVVLDVNTFTYEALGSDLKLLLAQRLVETLMSRPGVSGVAHLYVTAWHAASARAPTSPPPSVHLLGTAGVAWGGCTTPSAKSTLLRPALRGLGKGPSPPLVVFVGLCSSRQALCVAEAAMAVVQTQGLDDVSRAGRDVCLLVDGSHHAGLRGLVRSSRIWGDVRRPRLRCAELVPFPSSCAHAIPLLAAQCGSAETELMANIEGNTARIPRLCRIPRQTADASRPSDLESTHVITGGTGGIGWLSARWLADGGARCLVLVSRSGRLNAAQHEQRQQLPTVACHLASGNLCEMSDWHRLLAATRCSSLALGGVWHAAGTLHSHIQRHSAHELQSIFTPKASGVLNIRASTTTLLPALMVFFSSTSALFGNSAQSTYSAASCCLDANADSLQGRGLRGTSVQWASWASTGMAAGEEVQRRRIASGFLLIEPTEGLAALKHMSSSPRRPCVVAMAPISWSILVGSIDAVPALLCRLPEVATSAEVEDAASDGHGVRRACNNMPEDGAGPEALPPCQAVERAVVDEVQRAVGRPVDADLPLMDAGIDSLGAMDLRTQLGQHLGVTLPSMLLFDFPTVRQITKKVHSLSSCTRGAASGGLSECGASLIGETFSEEMPSAPVQIVGLASTLPKGTVGHHGLRVVTSCGESVVSQVPPERWVFLPSGEDANTSVFAAMQYGSFVLHADRFDAEAFSISQAEVEAMDPQQRLLLEAACEAFHTAQKDRAALSDSSVGVFVGMAAHDFDTVLKGLPAGASIYAATGTNHAIASGRIAFTLGLMGPCCTYETSCSATLVAAHAARQALRLKECLTTLVAGVNLILHPADTRSFAAAGMLSMRGSCHTFDSRADGYVRAEACCATILSDDPGCSAFSLSGSAVRQDGRSASLTAPNGVAQQGVILAALVDACVVASAMAQIEAHGTGTPLGDPIEVGSLAAAVLSGRDATATLGLVTAVKANTGHAEPVAGMTGLLGLMLGLEYAVVAPNAQLRTLNPHLGSMLPCVLPMHATSLLAAGLQGGVSSFGYSGTIAHTVIHHASGGDELILAAPHVLYRRRAHSWNKNGNIEARHSSLGPPLFSPCWLPLPSTAHRSMTKSSLAFVIVSHRSRSHTGCGSFSTADMLAPQLLVLCLGDTQQCAHSLDGSQCALVLTQVVTQLVDSAPILLLTCGALTQQPAHGGLWSFARVLRLEHPVLQFYGADVWPSSSAGVAVHSAPFGEPELVWHQGQCKTRRLRCAARFVWVGGAGRASGSCMITGGLGGLGLRSAWLLILAGASRLVLVSRSGHAQHGTPCFDAIFASSVRASVQILACDVADPAEASSMSHTHTGVLHAVRKQARTRTGCADAMSALHDALIATHASLEDLADSVGPVLCLSNRDRLITASMSRQACCATRCSAQQQLLISHLCTLQSPLQHGTSPASSRASHSSGCVSSPLWPPLLAMSARQITLWPTAIWMHLRHLSS